MYTNFNDSADCSASQTCPKLLSSFRFESTGSRYTPRIYQLFPDELINTLSKKIFTYRCFVMKTLDFYTIVSRADDMFTKINAMHMRNKNVQNNVNSALP